MEKGEKMDRSGKGEMDSLEREVVGMDRRKFKGGGG